MDNWSTNCQTIAHRVPYDGGDHTACACLPRVTQGRSSGCIADDVTGATDLADALRHRGLATLLVLGLPHRPIPHDVDAVVIALKTRSIPSDQAEVQSVIALGALRQCGVSHVYFKDCSTFDSTSGGNIGPVANRLCAELGLPHSRTARRTRGISARLPGPPVCGIPVSGRVADARSLCESDDRLEPGPAATTPDRAASGPAPTRNGGIGNPGPLQGPGVHGLLRASGGQATADPLLPPGSAALGDAVRDAGRANRCLLLAQHGSIAAANSMSAALDAVEEIEETSRLFLLLAGTPARSLSRATARGTRSEPAGPERLT